MSRLARAVQLPVTMLRWAVVASLSLVGCSATPSQFVAATTSSSDDTTVTADAPIAGVGLLGIANEDGTLLRSCSVTLIDAMHVITTRTCVDGVDASALGVSFAATARSNDGSWIDVDNVAGLGDALVSITLAKAAGVTPFLLNRDTLADDLAGSDGHVIAYSAADDHFRNSATGVVTRIDETTLIVKNSGSTADEGGAFVLRTNGAYVVIGVGGTTTDGTTFMFQRTDVLSFAE